MRVAQLTTFAVNKKEPLVNLLDRILAAFESSGLGTPQLQFTLADAPVAGFVSSVDRVLRRYPQLKRFLTDAPISQGVAGQMRRLSNSPPTPEADPGVDLKILREIATGVPKSFPFHYVTFHLSAAAFGGDGLPPTAETPQPVRLAREDFPPITVPVTAMMASTGMLPGVMLGDNWWVNGRQRSLMALTIVEADHGSGRLPPVSPPVAAVLAACGKARRIKQVPLDVPAGAALMSSASTAPPAISTDIKQTIDRIVQDYTSRIADIVAHAKLPHDLPPKKEALASRSDETPGPMKPALERTFRSLGYACKSERQGMHTLRRRRASNLTVELHIEVGRISPWVSAYYRVQGLGFSAHLPLPVAPGAMPGHQYPVYRSERWQQIVDNLAALVTELERTFVPAIEAVAGPSPAWYQPTR